MNLFGRPVGINQRFFLLAGPCVVESESLQIEVAGQLKTLCDELGILLIFKSSFDKANRTSSRSFRGLGRAEGLRILSEVKRQIHVPVVTDVHNVEDVHEAANHVDMLQIPAFLCRQTDLIEAAALSGKAVNIKKGQFLAPEDMVHVVAKARAANPEAALCVCERGTTFGYHNLVVDMRGLETMRSTGCPVIFDATHAVQLPGGAGEKSGGQRQFVPTLARAAVAVGVAGLFMETHPTPDQALSDGPNNWPLDKMRPLLESLLAIDDTVKSASHLAWL
ncbi:MAG: 3-deoxy-8-phosphooctulonate synthase [Pseudomonadota bacterium]